MKSYTKVYIPYGGYYSTPFCRWQGSMQYDNAITLGANTARKWFLEKKIDPTIIDYLFFGTTVAQHHWFFAHQWSGSILTDDKKYVPGLFTLMLHKNSEIDSLKLKQLFSKRQETASNLL